MRSLITGILNRLLFNDDSPHLLQIAADFMRLDLLLLAMEELGAEAGEPPGAANPIAVRQSRHGQEQRLDPHFLTTAIRWRGMELWACWSRSKN